MGAREQFIFRSRELDRSQLLALKGCNVAITTDEKLYMEYFERDEAIVLVENKDEITCIKNAYIVASNIEWKQTFRKVLKKNKIKYRTYNC